MKARIVMTIEVVFEFINVNHTHLEEPSVPNTVPNTIHLPPRAACRLQPFLPGQDHSLGG